MGEMCHAPTKCNDRLIIFHNTFVTLGVPYPPETRALFPYTGLAWLEPVEVRHELSVAGEQKKWAKKVGKNRVLLDVKKMRGQKMFNKSECHALYCT